MWGVFQEGGREGYGADADHLKTTADLSAKMHPDYIDLSLYIDKEDRGILFVDNTGETLYRLENQ